MSLDTASQLGQMLGSIINQQSNLQNNLSPDDPNGQFGLYAFEDEGVSDAFTLNLRTIATDSFVLDHPVYCVLDSSVLNLDGGYSATQTLTSTDGVTWS